MLNGCTRAQQLQKLSPTSVNNNTPSETNESKREIHRQTELNRTREDKHRRKRDHLPSTTCFFWSYGKFLPCQSKREPEPKADAALPPCNEGRQSLELPTFQEQWLSSERAACDKGSNAGGIRNVMGANCAC